MKDGILNKSRSWTGLDLANIILRFHVKYFTLGTALEALGFQDFRIS